MWGNTSCASFIDTEVDFALLCAVDIAVDVVECSDRSLALRRGHADRCARLLKVFRFGLVNYSNSLPQTCSNNI